MVRIGRMGWNFAADWVLRIEPDEDKMQLYEAADTAELNKTDPSHHE